MSMFYLERDDGYGSDLECPSCHTTFDVGWNTEYGEPILGEHDVECLDCNAKLTMRVGSTIEIDAIPKEG